jgi:DNA-binding NarL/FixJ family response regulator
MDPVRQSQIDAAWVAVAVKLSPRELEVLWLVAAGYANREIATELGVTYLTVRTHVRSILQKLGVSTRLQAAMFGVRHGLIEPS